MTIFTDHYNPAPNTITSAGVAYGAAIYLRDSASHVRSAANQLHTAANHFYPRHDLSNSFALTANMTSVPAADLSLRKGTPPAPLAPAYLSPSATPSPSSKSTDKVPSQNQHYLSGLTSSPFTDSVRSDLSQTLRSPHRTRESSTQDTKRQCPACGIVSNSFSDFRRHLRERHVGLEVDHNAGPSTVIEKFRCPYCWVWIDRTRITGHLDSGCAKS